MLNALKILVWAFSIVVLAGCGKSGPTPTTIYSNPSNTVTTMAGAAGIAGSVDGTGTAARFNHPFGITTDGTNLYVADTYNNVVRQIVIATGAVTTLAGTAGPPGSADGTGTAATFYSPTGIVTDADGTNLYLTDYGNHTVRQIVIATGAVTTLAGIAGTAGSADGTGNAATFWAPAGITTDGTNLYVADYNNNTIRKIEIASGAVTTLAGTPGAFGSADGIGPGARFSYPFGITTDGTNLYVADSNNSTVRRIEIATRTVMTVAGNPGVPGWADATGGAANFNYPLGIATDGTHLYVADSSSHTIRKIIISTGAVTTVAGVVGVPGSADGAGPLATFLAPAGLTTQGTDLYVADTNNSTIRKIK